MSNENATVSEIIGTSEVVEVVETPKKKAKPTKVAKSQKKGNGATAKATPKKEANKGSKKDKSYKRGSLSAAINALFDKEGVDEVGYGAAEKLARLIKPDTKFNRYHLAWYKNNYRNNQPS